jgi:hypothetical protein
MIVDGQTMYMPDGEAEVHAVKALMDVLGLQKDVVDAVVVAAVNKLLGTTYLATDIVNDIAAVTAAVQAAMAKQPKRSKWMWPVLISAIGMTAIAGGVFYFRRRDM